MAGSYAEVWEYREDTGDAASADERVSAMLYQQSAKLRAVCGIHPRRPLSADQLALARALVTDAARKALVPPSFAGIEDMTGARQASFSANGFQASATFTNPGGSAFFDASTLKALKRSLGRSQQAFSVMPIIGGR